MFVRQGHIYIQRSDGSHRRKLTNGSDDGGPAFSPDGKRIVLTHPGRGRGAGPQPELWVIEIHGHHAHRSGPTGSPG